ncbi:MAG TPA: tRNA-dihydrouridine synthase [Patescibacteria group bacterium]|nr:tRNA-dihydrouridine synthase [Patescibacteria group bacterium]
MKNFWQELPKPIYALAPMEAVTDTVFRRIVAYCGRPTVFFTEFTNVDGLFSKGKKEVEHRLLFTPDEKPLIAQLWGMIPENYTKAAELVAEMGFDGIDINMGCPERSVVKRGACAGLINNPEHAGEIIKAVKKGAGNLPVSVKTRIGVKEIVTESWISFLLEQDVAALTVHLRTAREMSNPPPHWEELPKIVDLKNKINPNTILLANGNIESLTEANEKVKQYGIDGVMVGRGIFKDPFLFDGKKKLDEMSLSERLDLLMTHATLFDETWNNSKHFAILRKFFKIYTLGLPNAHEVREKLMNTNNIDDVREIVKTLTS